MDKEYFVYMLRCKDDSIYTGITCNLEKRYLEHKNGKGAKYTRNKGVKKIEISFLCENKSDALKIEWYIKKHPKRWKELIITDLSIIETQIFKDLKIKIKKLLTHTE